MPPTEGPPVRDDKEDRLTLEDVGAKDIGVHPAYRAKQDKVMKSLDKKSSNPAHRLSTGKKVGVAAVATLATLTGVKAVESSATNSEIDQVETVQASEQNEPPQHIESDIKPGDVVNVLTEPNFQFNTNDVNVRTSPEAVDASDTEDDNLADVPWLGAGQTIVVAHALVQEDLRNVSNGNWYGFMDGDGKVYWVNSNALAEAGVQINPAYQEVTIQDTTSNGVIAQDSNGLETVVATVVAT